MHACICTPRTTTSAVVDKLLRVFVALGRFKYLIKRSKGRDDWAKFLK